MKTLMHLLGLLLLACPGVVSAGETVDAIIADQKARGWRSPAAAIERLQAADDAANASATVEDRGCYHAEIGRFAAMSRGERMVSTLAAALSELDAMAAAGCGPCLVDKRLIQAQDALTQRQAEAADMHLREVAPRISTDDALRLHRLHHLRARVYRLRGSYAQGIAAGVQAIRLAERSGATAERLVAVSTVFSMTALLGDFARAQQLSEEAEAIARRLGFTYMLASIRLNQGHVYGMSRQPARQRAALEEAVKLAEGQPGMEDIEAVGHSNLSDYWLSTDDRKALAHARKAESLARRNGDPRSFALALTNAGVATAGLGDIEGGVALVRQAIATADRLGARGDVADITGELIRIYKNAGRYREALEATEKVAAIEQEITRQERDKTVLELQEKYVADRRQQEIDRLTASNRVKQAELEAKAWQQRLWATLALALLAAAVALVRWLYRVRHRNRKLSGDIAVLAEQSSHDALTGVFNRRHCQALMAQHAAARQVGVELAPVGLMLLDVDLFKKINDTHGHAAGDRVLVEIAHRLRGLVRQHDAVVRWGGEEFALLLPGTTAEGVVRLAERVLAVIADTPVSIGDVELPVTVSVGSIAFPTADGMSWDETLHLADLALYLSKAGGRNRATCITRVSADADPARLRRDLASAHAAGDVELQAVTGPECNLAVHPSVRIA